MNISGHELLQCKMHNYDMNRTLKLNFTSINLRLISYDLYGKMIFLDIGLNR